MSTLNLVLNHLGFRHRKQQDELYGQLLRADRNGVIVQAGTGTGKSIAVLAAAAEWRRVSDKPSVIVTPTKVLMDQYAERDAPAVAEATGLLVATLKGRRNYLCESAPAMKNPRDAKEKVEARNYLRYLASNTIPIEVDDPRFGCPGSGRHKSKETVCCATWAREVAKVADIVVTNLHILIIDRQLKDASEDGETGILPPFGALFVDEAHKFEETMRDFTTSSISVRKLNLLEEDAGRALIDILESMEYDGCGPRAVKVDRKLADAIVQVSRAEEIGDDDDDEDEPSVVGSAWSIIGIGQRGLYEAGAAVLHFKPGLDKGSPSLVSTWVNLGTACSDILTRQPVGLVSATIPSTMAACLGLREATVTDVGHPFDYRRQGKIAFSRASGSFKAAQDSQNFRQRSQELLGAIRGTQGGCLLLFSALRDMRAVHDAIAVDLVNDGRTVLHQGDAPNAFLAEQFRADGRAVLFGSASFATGFDVPGDALELVAIWKLPYPGLDPVTKAISNQSFRRYEDMMLMNLVQAAGRLIRSETDTGKVFVVDSRGRSKILATQDPMVRHLAQFQVMA